MKVKFFSRTGYTGSYKHKHHQELEDEVNAWLEQNRDVKIKDNRHQAISERRQLGQATILRYYHL